MNGRIVELSPENASNFSVENVAVFGNTIASSEGGFTTTTVVSSPGNIIVGQAGQGDDFLGGNDDDDSIVFTQSLDASAGVNAIVFGANVDTQGEVKSVVNGGGLDQETANTIVNAFLEFDNGNSTTLTVPTPDVGA